MPITSDIVLSINIIVMPHRDITLKMRIENKAERDYYISSESILLEGFKSMPFTISGPSYIVCYTGSSNGKDFTLINLKSNSYLEQSTKLSDFCEFENATPGLYTIKFQNAYHLFDENQKIIDLYVHLNATKSFLIGEDSVDLSLNSLNYESAL